MTQALSPEEIFKVTREKYRKAINESSPIFALYEITKACDRPCKYPMIDCKYCGLTNQSTEEELGTQEVYRLINNIAQSGTRSLSFVGGEPTTRTDLIDIVSHASGRMEISVITNGLAIDSKYAYKLRQARTSWVKIYIDSPDAELHDSLRGEGTHHQALQALENCKDEGIATSIINTVTPQNMDHLREMLRLSLEKKSLLEITEVLPSHDGKGSELILSKEQRKEVQMYLLEARKLFGRDRIRFAEYYMIGEDKEGMAVWADPAAGGFNVGYGWGIYGYGIKPNGKVVPDPLITIELGNLMEQRLTDIWANAVVVKNLRHRGRLKGKCGRCEYRFICGGHRGRVYVLTGDLMEEDPACWYEPSPESVID